MPEQLPPEGASQTKGSRTEETPEVNPDQWRVSAGPVGNAPNSIEISGINEQIEINVETPDELSQSTAYSTGYFGTDEPQDVPHTRTSIPSADQLPLYLTTDSTISVPINDPGLAEDASGPGAAGPRVFAVAGAPLGPPPAYEEVPASPPPYVRAVSDGLPANRYWTRFVSDNELPTRQTNSNSIINREDLHTSRCWPEYIPPPTQPTQPAIAEEESERIRRNRKNKMSYYLVCFTFASCIILGFSLILIWIVFS